LADCHFERWDWLGGTKSAAVGDGRYDGRETLAEIGICDRLVRPALKLRKEHDE
jgi:hypothetical protein